MARFHWAQKMQNRNAEIRNLAPPEKIPLAQIPLIDKCHWEFPHASLPKGPFRTKNTTTIEQIVNYYAVVFLQSPPNLLRRGPFSERKNVCNSQENVSAHGAPR